MAKRMIWAAVILVLLLFGLYHTVNRDAELPEDYSSAAAGLMLLEKPEGLYVLAVTQGSPADRSGVQPGDYLVTSGDEVLSELVRLDAVLDKGSQSIPLTLRREGKELQIHLPVR